MVVAPTAEFRGRIDRLSQRVASAIRARLHRGESRLRALEARSGFAGARGRVALRGRHVAELGHQLAAAARTRVAASGRRYLALGRRLEASDLRRRLDRVRTRLVTADGRLNAAFDRRRNTADVRLRSAVARLESLSPLAVLGRGYAVCWNEDRTRIIRDAATAADGDRVRITLEKGELDCQVRGRSAPPPGPPSAAPARPNR
jgi:exodeoxyribonuclease VII large subunit